MFGCLEEQKRPHLEEKAILSFQKKTVIKINGTVPPDLDFSYFFLFLVLKSTTTDRRSKPLQLRIDLLPLPRSENTTF